MSGMLETDPEIVRSTPARTQRRLVPHLPSFGFLQAVFFTYVVLALLAFAFLVPPLQKNDEPAHFQRAISITNGDVVCDKDSDGNYYFPMKYKYAVLDETLMTFETAFEYENKFDRKLLSLDYSDPSNDAEGRVYRFCNLPIPGYAASTVGVLIGKPFESPLVSLYAGRVFGALFFVFALVLSLRIVPEPYKLIVYFYAAMPTLLNQVSAVNYDAVQLSLFPLIFAFVTRFLVQERRIRPMQIVIFMGLLWWMINIRLLNYYPLLLLYFLIPQQKIATPFSRYALITGAFFAITLTTTIFFDTVYLPRATDSIPPGEGVDTDAQVNFVLEHPWHFFAAGYNTLDTNGWGYLREVIGTFGWVDHSLNWFPLDTAIFITGLVVYHTIVLDVPLLNPRRLLVLCAALLLTVVWLFFSLYVVWTPVAADSIAGLQGRYFSGLMPFAIFAVSQAVNAIGRRRAVEVLLAGFSIVLLYNIVRTILLRYYE